MKYYINYVLGYPESSNQKADIGTMVHKVMEVFAGLKKYQQDNPKKKFLETTDEAVGKVKVHKDKLLSKEFLIEMCELSFNSYKIKKAMAHHKWTDEELKLVKIYSRTGVSYNNGQFDPRLRNILDPEPHFDIPIMEDWAEYEQEMPDGSLLKGRLAIKGTIDLVTKVDDNTIEVIDWKTGQRKNWATGEKKDYKKLTKDPQLLLYYYAISHLYPQYGQTIMSIFFLKDGGPFSMCFDKEDKTMFLEMLKDRFEEIKSNVSPKVISENRSDFRCRILCDFNKNKWEESNKSMCKYVEDHIELYGIGETTNKLTRKGHTIGHYESPG